jgi:hypothetical protein
MFVQNGDHQHGKSTTATLNETRPALFANADGCHPPQPHNCSALLFLLNLDGSQLCTNNSDVINKMCKPHSTTSFAAQRSLASRAAAAAPHCAVTSSRNVIRKLVTDCQLAAPAGKAHNTHAIVPGSGSLGNL